MPLANGEATLTVEMMLSPDDEEPQQLAAAEVAQGKLASAYAGLQSAPLVLGKVTALVQRLVGTYKAALVDYKAAKFAEAAAGAGRVVAALHRDGEERLASASMPGTSAFLHQSSPHFKITKSG